MSGNIPVSPAGAGVVEGVLNPLKGLDNIPPKGLQLS